MARLSRYELASLRSGVQLMFDAPSDQEMTKLVATCERIHGRWPSTRVQNYLIRLYRVQGPQTAALMEQIFRERGTTENLLLAVEIHPRTLAPPPVAIRDTQPDPDFLDAIPARTSA